MFGSIVFSYNPILIPLIYLAAISLISTVVCTYDKIAAKHFQKHRTRERTLLFLSAIGGSVAMLITMLIIRHKTKHKKFMVGIPLIITAQAVLIFLALYFIR